MNALLLTPFLQLIEWEDKRQMTRRMTTSSISLSHITFSFMLPGFPVQPSVSSILKKSETGQGKTKKTNKTTHYRTGPGPGHRNMDQGITVLAFH